jgi:hypothetical protein
MSEPTTAWHNDPKLRARYLRGLAWHAEQDAIVQRTYGTDTPDGWRGCSIACLHRSGQAAKQRTGGEHKSHAELAAAIGIPEHVLYLADSIFEALPPAKARAFAIEWPNAIKTGADLSLVWPRFAVWMLTDPEHGVRRLYAPAGAAETDAVAALYERRIASDEPTNKEWARAQQAAVAAEVAVAALAAEAADAAVAARAAQAAWAWTSVAAEAARAGETAGAAPAVNQAATLVRLLREAGR